jgi:DNA-binding LacI/PurR family transcriptional regulator
MDDEQRAVTSVDVAAESGFSQATVARVFSSPHLVSPTTRATVEDAANRLGYVPNAIARSLKSQRTNIVAAVVPARGEYWQQALTSFSRHLAARDLQLLLFSFSDGADVARVIDSVQQYRVDGILLASTNVSLLHLARLSPGATPVVAFNHPAAAGIVPAVSVDNAAGTAALAQHLVHQGCRNVLFVGGQERASTDQARYRGAAQELGRHGAACGYIEAGSFGYDDGYKAATHIAELDTLPDAVMVSGDELAFGVLDGFRTVGIDVPNDLLLTGFDGLPQASWAGYDLTTIVQSMDSLAQQAIEVLLQPDANNDHPADVVVPGTLRIGKTTRRPLDG